MYFHYTFDPALLRARIQERGFQTIDSFARSAKLHRNTLLGYLNGEKSILSSAASRICRTLAIDPMTLATNQAVAPPADSDFFKAILDACSALCSANLHLACALFGSRARGAGAMFSDFDLGFTCGTAPLSADRYLEFRLILEDAFDNLPVSIDIVNLDEAPGDFLAAIAPDLCYLCGDRVSFAYAKGKSDGLRRL